MANRNTRPLTMASSTTPMLVMTFDECGRWTRLAMTIIDATRISSRPNRSR